MDVLAAGSPKAPTAQGISTFQEDTVIGVNNSSTPVELGFAVDHFTSQLQETSTGHDWFRIGIAGRNAGAHQVRRFQLSMRSIATRSGHSRDGRQDPWLPR